ncbi:MAG: hypothetical protein JOY83_01200 [Alphaproteobacteria bacterium]|nr:hypothetical protein [Alphaproteobacteria bacterium]
MRPPEAARPGGFRFTLAPVPFTGRAKRIAAGELAEDQCERFRADDNGAAGENYRNRDAYIADAVARKVAVG